LLAAGGTLPVIKKDEQRGVFVMVETAVGDHGHAAAKPAPAAKAEAPKAATPAAKAAPAAVPKPAGEHKPGAQPNRQLFRRSTYAGVKDIGPVAGETFEQKVARLKAVSAGAKQRAEEGGGEAAPTAADAAPEVLTALAPDQEVAAPAAPAPAHKPTGNADRTLMKRSTYCGVKDTGPVPGETFQQKIARLAAVSAAAKQRSEGG
jgi:pyruvate dehydrogenase E2 component (dihydrolipoamide acetyltransferase)